MKKLFKSTYLPYFMVAGLVLQVLSSYVPVWRGNAPEATTYRNMTFVLSYDRAEDYELENFKANYGRKASLGTFCELGFGPMAHAALSALQEEDGLLLVHPCVWRRILAGLEMARERNTSLATNVERWDMFDTTTGLFLFVPKTWRDADKSAKRTSFVDHRTGRHLTQEEVDLGVKINNLKRIENPFATTQLNLKQDKRWESRVTRVLVTKQDLGYQASAQKTFSIFMTGHGAPPCDHEQGTLSRMVNGYDPRCCSLFMSRWGTLLHTLEDHVSVNILCVDTCYGLAEHFKRYNLLDKVSFPIVSMTCTEAETFGVCQVRRQSGSHTITISKDVPLFFQKVRDLAWETDADKRTAQLADAMSYMVPTTGRFVYQKTHHIPAVLWPKTNAFKSVVIDPVCEKKLSKLDATLETNVDLIHVDVGNVGMVSIAGKTPRFVSVMPGDTEHTFEKLTTKNGRSILEFAKNFFSVDDLESKKTINIKKLSLGNQDYQDVVICHDPAAAYDQQDSILYRDSDGRLCYWTV